MDYTNIKVYFDISGNAFPVDEITKILEISPTLTYLKGDSIRGKKIKRKETSWELGSEYQISYDVNNQLVPIINQLLSKEKELIRIREKYSVSFIH
ncbi:MAG: DUF4279 domain-containing protein [Niallia nealsonii]|nr:DUF4279 domain-containing protein [Niallia nealsonii]